MFSSFLVPGWFQAKNVIQDFSPGDSDYFSREQCPTRNNFDSKTFLCPLENSPGTGQTTNGQNPSKSTKFLDVSSGGLLTS
jgi:hypothetical protein